MPGVVAVSAVLAVGFLISLIGSVRAILVRAVHALDHHDPGERTVIAPFKLRRVVEHIEANLADKITVARETLKEHSGVEGMWPSEHLVERRAEARAEHAELLERVAQDL